MKVENIFNRTSLSNRTTLTVDKTGDKTEAKLCSEGCQNGTANCVASYRTDLEIRFNPIITPIALRITPPRFNPTIAVVQAQPWYDQKLKSRL